jgi:hypothetical protein
MGRAENTVSKSISIVARVSFATGTCLLSQCLETALVYLLILWPLHSNSSTCYSIFQSFIKVFRYFVNMWRKVLDFSKTVFMKYFSLFWNTGNAKRTESCRHSIYRIDDNDLLSIHTYETTLSSHLTLLLCSCKLHCYVKWLKRIHFYHEKLNK